MSDAYDCLAAWRQAERLRDSIPRGSAAWIVAEHEVRHASLVYHATVAQTAARYGEATAVARSVWWPAHAAVSHGSAR